MRKPYCIEVWEDGELVAERWIRSEMSESLERMHQNSMRMFAENRSSNWELVYSHVRSRGNIRNPFGCSGEIPVEDRFLLELDTVMKYRKAGIPWYAIRDKIKCGKRLIQMFKDEEDKTSRQRT